MALTHGSTGCRVIRILRASRLVVISYYGVGRLVFSSFVLAELEGRATLHCYNSGHSLSSLLSCPGRANLPHFLVSVCL